jgi:hypothetical protein
VRDSQQQNIRENIQYFHSRPLSLSLIPLCKALRKRNKRNLELEDLKWLILIQSKDWINFDPVSTIQYYHVSKIRQYGWLIYSWIINEFEM